MDLRLFLCEILCAAGALVPLAGEWYYLGRFGRRDKPFYGPWLASAGFALYAFDIDVLRRTIERGPEHIAAIPWILALSLAGSVGLTLGVWNYGAFRPAVHEATGALP
jgi:hypothetical protein